MTAIIVYFAVNFALMMIAVLIFWDYISGGIVILELVVLIVILIKKM